MFVNVTLEARLRHVCRWQCIWTHHPRSPREKNTDALPFCSAQVSGGPREGRGVTRPGRPLLKRFFASTAFAYAARTMSSMLCHPCACTVRACSSIGIAARPSRKAARLRRPVGLRWGPRTVNLCARPGRGVCAARYYREHTHTHGRGVDR